MAAAADPPRDITPIGDLSGYTMNATLCARASQKTDMKRFTSYGNTQGQFFRVTLKDPSGGIVGVAWGGDADRLFGVVENNKAYFVSGFVVKQSKNDRFGQEIHFTGDTVIEEVSGISFATEPFLSHQSCGCSAGCLWNSIRSARHQLSDLRFRSRKHHFVSFPR